MKIKATFYTIMNQVYKEGIYSSMKRVRSVRDRYELQYGACLRMVTQEVA